MALNPRLIDFFVERIENAETDSFGSSTAQLFEHLKTEVKDNPVYDQYEAGIAGWEKWPDESSFYGRELLIPKKYQDAKNLTYTLYKRVAEEPDVLQVLYEVTNQDNFNDGLKRFNKMFLEYLKKVLEDIIKANPELDMGGAEKKPGSKVFIIHGHDVSLKTQLQLLLERAGINYTVLHEQADKGRSIVDKLLEEAKDANYAIGILTPDDILKDGQGRARQNVILEIGYFLGFLGKERVRMLVKGNTEIPSDLYGVLYEKHDDSGAWKMKILKEMIAVGIYADTKAVIDTL